MRGELSGKGNDRRRIDSALDADPRSGQLSPHRHNDELFNLLESAIH